jgi:hypothetical protein
MRFFDLLARLLLGAAVAVLVLRGYVALDTASASDELGGGAGRIVADGIASALRDAGILLALAGAMIALDRRSQPRPSA